MDQRLASLVNCSLLAILAPCVAYAQEIGSTAPRVLGEDSEYANRAAEFGHFRLTAGGEARIAYDSNVFAEPIAGSSDGVLTVSPYAEISRDNGRFSFRLRGSLNLRRHDSETTENSEAARVMLQTRLDLPQGQTLTSAASWDRAVEERGDPEARTQLGLGPRLYDVTTGTVAYRRASPRMLVSVNANIQEVNALSANDDDRDFTTFFGQAGIGLRPGGPFYVTGTAFANRREFRLEEIVPGVDRDTTTYGGRLGLQFDDDGFFEGSIAAGAFQLESDDPVTPSRTGFSLDGLLTYRPQRRTAISFEVFRGDVASFRGGASARTDTRVGVHLEQEMFHNFLGRLTVDYQESAFFGTGQNERTWRTGAEVEYLVSRNASLVATVRYADRNSDFAFEEFDRFNAGAGVRFRF